MKICFATNQAVALTHGGIRTQMLQTKSALEASGVTVELFDMWGSFEPSSYDLVHVFSSNIGTYHFARALRTHGVPFVVSPVFFSRRSSSVIRSVIRADRVLNRIMRGVWTDYGLMAEMCGWANAVLPNSQAEARIFIDALGVRSERVHVVPNGVEERFASSTPELFHKTYGSESFVLSVTHVGPERKNVARMLQALEGIERKVIVVGPIDETAEASVCKDLAKRNPRIGFLGPLPHDSDLLASAYAACDAFVLPSLFETPGIAALEAGLAGATLVITAHGGPQEYFGNEAEYVEPTSVESIRNGIQHALSKPKTTTLQQRIRERYLWEHVAKHTLSAYERALQR